MQKALRVRPMTDEEIAVITRLAHARTEPARLVERAQMVWLSCHGLHVPAIATQLRRTEQTVRVWLKRFNAGGVAALTDEARVGRPATYTPEQVSELIAASLTDPQQLGLPFGSWTLDRLAAYLNQDKGIPIKRSRIDEILRKEGLRWWHQESWFGERVDPQFAEKRGPSSASTPSHRTGA
jgi:transposase